MKKIILLAVLSVAYTTFFAQTRYYVDQNAAGQNTGVSWPDAFTNLHDAMVAAVSGDEIWVAEGTYHPSENDRTVYYSLLSGVQLYGSFSGSEMLVEERNIAAHPTILDGDIGVKGDSLDNTYNILYLFRPDSTTLVDGFVFQNGQSDKITGGTGGFGNSGAAILIHGNNAFAYPTIRNCIFEDNYSRYDGGAICATGGTTGDEGLVVEYCKFKRNKTNSRGGALCELGGSNHFTQKGFYHCEFKENEGVTAGAGLYYSSRRNGNRINIVDCLFENNIIQDGGGSPRTKSVGFSNPTDSISYLSIIDSRFFENRVVVSMIGHDPTFYNIGRVYISVKNSVFNNFGYFPSPTSGAGSSIFSIESFPENMVPVHQVDNCKFFISATSGIGLSNSDSLLITNSYFAENENFLGFYIGAANKLVFKNNIYRKYPGPYTAINNNQFYNGPFLFFLATSTIIENSSILKNQLSFYGDTLIIVNSVVDSDSLSTDLYPQHEIQGISLSSNLFTFSIKPNLPSFTDTNNLWSTDPQFINPEAGDLHLQPCSPAINAGDNSLVSSTMDIEGNERIRYGTVDMGAYEMGQLVFNVTALSGPDCSGTGQSTGTIDLSAIEACPPVAYTWDNGLPPVPVQSGLEAGTYTATVTDAKGRSVVQTVQIGTYPPPVLSPLATPVFCGTSQAGTVTLVTAGLGPFAFTWPDGAPDSLRMGLMSGLYTVTVTDVRGCTAEGMATVGRTGFLEINIHNTAVTCAGGADGALEVVPGNGLPPFGWLWDNGSTSSQISGLPAGQYSGSLTDALGCTVQWTLPIDEPDTISMAFEMTPASGPAVADGSITLQPAGGAGGFAVLWSNGAQEFTISGLMAGVYTATVTDANNCTRSQTFTVTDLSATDDANPVNAKIWPNPALAWLWVEVPEQTGPFSFLLTDMNGKEVFQTWSAGTLAVNVRELPRGTYIWHIITDKNAGTGRVVVD